MNKNIFKAGFGMAALAMMSLSLMTSCNKEPDESNLYSFTGQTIEDYLLSNDSLSAFNEILIKSRL